MGKIFKKIDGCEIEVEKYTKDYLKTHPQCEVIIGCDSQNRRGMTQYALVMGFYNPGHGAHIIFRRWKTKKEKVIFNRLINEVWASLELAEELKKANIVKVKWIDIDINPSPKFKSNEAFSQAIGMCEGMGYKVRYKTLAPLVITMADALARK